jgi:hypothetical protein
MCCSLGSLQNSEKSYAINRLGEIRDRSFKQQRYQLAAVNLVTAAIELWNTMYLERATQAMSELGKPVDGELQQYLSPAGRGSNQLDWRLCLVAEQQAGGREVPVVTDAWKTLAYDFFQILRAP